MAVRAEQSEILRPVAGPISADVINVQWHTSTGWVQLGPAALFTPLPTLSDEHLSDVPVRLAVRTCAANLASHPGRGPSSEAPGAPISIFVEA